MIVSDHALLRYLERHHDLDIENMKRLISDKMKEHGGVDGIFPFGGDTQLNAVIREGVLVTFLKDLPRKVAFGDGPKIGKRNKKSNSRNQRRINRLEFKRKKAHIQETELANVLFAGKCPSEWEQ